MESKKLLRAHMREIEKAFLASGKASRETSAVLSALERDSRFVSAGCVLMYMSIPGEVETADFIARWHGSKRIVIPRVVGEELELFEYDPDRLVPGYLGILEPSDDAVRVDPSEIDLAVIPGVAFSRLPDGRVLRMGHGKGFYDRLLPQLSCPKLGICFGFRVLSEIPSDAWDVPLDGLLCGE